MKSLLLFVSLILSVLCYAQPDEVKVENAVAALHEAMINGDGSRLEKMVHVDLSYGHSGGMVENKESFIRRLVNGESDFVTISITEQQVKTTGKTTIVRHVLQADTNDGGKPGKVHLKVIQVWIKSNGKWQLLARQAVKVS